MAEVIVAPSAALAAVTILRAGLGGMHVGTRVPATRPGRFVTVTQAGGRPPNMVTAAGLLIVQAWDDDSRMGEFRSHDTAALCAGLLRESVGATVAGIKVRWWEQMSDPAWLPDPDTGIPRFQITGELRVAKYAL